MERRYPETRLSSRGFQNFAFRRRIVVSGKRDSSLVESGERRMDFVPSTILCTTRLLCKENITDDPGATSHDLVDVASRPPPRRRTPSFPVASAPSAAAPRIRRSSSSAATAKSRDVGSAATTRAAAARWSPDDARLTRRLVDGRDVFEASSERRPRRRPRRRPHRTAPGGPAFGGPVFPKPTRNT